MVGATTTHHHNLHKHPAIPNSLAGADSDAATQCPALQKVVDEPKSRAMDDEVCPVIGPATTVLPPDHPSTADAKESDVCPVTKATVGHHKGKIHHHPSLLAAEKGAVCPVRGVKV